MNRDTLGGGSNIAHVAVIWIF